MGYLEEINYIHKPRKVKLDMDDIITKAKGNKSPKPKRTHIDLRKSFVLDIDSFLNEFERVDKMTDEELELLVVNNYTSILELVPRTKDHPEYAKKLMDIITNTRILNIFAKILNYNQLSYYHRIYLNNLIYDYLVFTHHANSEVRTLLFRIANAANMDIIPKLLGTGLNQDFISYLAICRYSSTNEFVCIKRVNLAIFLEAVPLSLQSIVDIYQYMFSKSIGTLFEGVMFDVYPKDELDMASEIQKELYGLMGTAVLELLNVMPLSSIKIILSGYVMDGVGVHKRFSLNLSADYSRINQVIEELRMEGVAIY